MLTHPLFWIYLFIQLRIFLHLTNSVSFHPRWRINETSWTLFWTILFLSSQTLLSFYLMREWDFAFWEWPILSGPCKLFSAGVYGWGGYLWLNHPYWVIFKKKKPLYKLLSRKKVQVPAKFKAPFGFLKSIGLENQIYQPEILEYEVGLPGWPEAFSGLSIVQISDVHYGKYVPLSYLKIVFEAAKKLKPDLYAFTGDYISFEKDIRALKGLFKGFKAPLGVYSLLGNHDHWADAPAVQKILEADGVRVLRNDVVYLKRKNKTLALMAVDDFWVGDRDDRPVLSAKGDAKILLAHQPAHLYLAKRLGAHLQISGHCHGGQICFPILGPVIIPSVEGRKYAGGFVREENTTLFIHRGIGGYPPLRTLCPPEIVKLILRPA